MTIGRRRRAGERGFTLIEVLVALTVFTLVTVGVVPLFVSSLRGSHLSRSFTIGKNAVLEEMERIRGLPFFTSFSAQNSKVDLLDLYFPSTSPGPGQSYEAGAKTFITTCTGSASANPACPRRLPEGYTLVYRASFVTPNPAETPETYNRVAPNTGYAWNSLAGLDKPRTQIVEIVVEGKWLVLGDEKSFALTSLVGDRRFGGVKVKGFSNLEYAIQVTTNFDHDHDGDAATPGLKSNLSLTAGSAVSKVESRQLSEASQTVNAGQLRLVRSGAALGDDLAGSPLSGATSALQAPPSSTPAGAVTGPRTLVHADLGASVAFLDRSITQGLSAQVTNELPRSTGGFGLSGGADPLDAWLGNQAETAPESALKLNAVGWMVALQNGTNSGETSAETTAPVGATRKVETKAAARFGALHVLPVRIPRVGFEDSSVLVLESFSSSVTCKSTAVPATAVTEGVWAITIRYLRDFDLGIDDTPIAVYDTISIDHTNFGAALAQLRADNPLVYDGTSDRDELNPNVYLFEDAASGKKGYLRQLTGAAPTVSVDAEGRTTSASVGGALRVDTVPTNPLLPDTAISVSVGNLHCQAVDRR